MMGDTGRDRADRSAPTAGRGIGTAWWRHWRPSARDPWAAGSCGRPPPTTTGIAQAFYMALGFRPGRDLSRRGEREPEDASPRDPPRRRQRHPASRMNSSTTLHPGRASPLARGYSPSRNPEIGPRTGVCFGSHMRLVTYDRGGHRRLGAILEAEVVDLPDAVGHPAFPSTLEDLVSCSRGTVMDAARAALQRDDAWNWRVPKPRILTPAVPPVPALATRHGRRAADRRPRAAGALARGRRLARLRAHGGGGGRQRGVEGRGRRGARRRLRLHAGERLAGALGRRRAGRVAPTACPSRSARASSRPTRSTRSRCSCRSRSTSTTLLKGNLNGAAA